MKRLRNYFISGLLFWIPLALSVLLIKFFLEIVNNLVPTRLLPESLLNLDTTIPGSGIFLVILVILITGALVTNILGRKLLDLWERALNKIPGFRNIYNALKKISSTVLNTKDAVELQMSVEEAFKLVISAGVVTPENLKIKEKK